jgi:hypothetical protein
VTILPPLPAKCATSLEETPMSQTVADLIAETLHAAGVKRIYGVVGDSLNGITDSLRKQ